MFLHIVKKNLSYDKIRNEHLLEKVVSPCGHRLDSYLTHTHSSSHSTGDR